MTIYDDACRIPELRNMIAALADFVQTIDPPGPYATRPFTRKGRRWVYARSFITFEFQTSRNRQVVMTLDGKPFEFRAHRQLALQPYRTGYSKAIIENAGQLAAAASYVEQSLRLCLRGRRRKRTIAASI